ncbi:MAG: NAD(P)H-quinone oxidoreductase [Alphaproteobacteria bacterium]
MTAIAIREPGGPEVLVPAELPVPSPAPGQVLVRVAASGVNRPDVVQRLGLYPPPPGAPDTPGLEVAGEVVKTGPGVDGLSIGDRVTALVAGGGYAEYCVVDAPLALPVPSPLTMEEAAALPETFFTVWTNVFDRARLQAGERFLVHGGSSGIGTTAIQLANVFGARVFATAGSAEKCAACERLGAERAINYREEDFVEAVKDATNGEGVDVILDMVGGDYVARNIACLRREGRLVNIAFLKGAKVELDLLPVMLKRLTLTGSTLRARALEEKAQIAGALRREVWPLLEAGRVGPVMDSRFPLAEAAAAHARMESGAHIGKIVLTGAQD